MEVKNIALELLKQIKEVCFQLNSEDYNRPLAILSNSSIGAHNRHSIEFFQMLEKGFKEGVISYDNRLHDRSLESDPKKAIEAIDNICFFLENCHDSELTLEVNYPQSMVSTSIPTTLKREIVYNIEHLVHHMAIVKIGIKENFPSIFLNQSFGVAQSTIAFQSLSS